MISTEPLDVDRRPTHAEPLDIDRHRAASGTWRREFYLTVLIIVFTMAQAWACVVVLTTRDGSPTALAIGLSLGGGVMAVINGWRYILRRNRLHVDV